VLGIACFKCVSIDGKNRACEDPFHNNVTGNYILETEALEEKYVNGNICYKNGIDKTVICDEKGPALE
jgi:hypothetical protein